MKITRRSILQAVVVAVPGLEACSSSVDSTTPVVDGLAYFPQSLASGDPRPDSVILWTRAVDAAKPDGDCLVTLEVASDAAFATVVARRANLRAAQTHDNALKVKLTGLSPRTTYYYR